MLDSIRSYVDLARYQHWMMADYERLLPGTVHYLRIWNYSLEWEFWQVMSSEVAAVALRMPGKADPVARVGMRLVVDRAFEAAHMAKMVSQTVPRVPFLEFGRVVANRVVMVRGEGAVYYLVMMYSNLYDLVKLGVFFPSIELAKHMNLVAVDWIYY